MKSRSAPAKTVRPPVNLFGGPRPPARGERFETLLRRRNVRIERIVSSATPGAAEVVQEQDEWVALLAGEATLEVAGRAVELRAGDAVHLPPRTRHRVLRTTRGALWLAVHIREESPGRPGGRRSG